MTRKPGRAKITGEHYTHRYLWNAARSLRERGRPDEDGNGILLLASTLFVYLAVEAYSNDLGPRVCPKEWATERTFFNSKPYQGTLGKLAYLAKALDVPVHRSRRPFQTLKVLAQRRDMVVHGRTEVIEREVRYRDPRKLKNVPPAIFALADEHFLDRALSDAESFCDSLQQAAYIDLGQHVIQSPYAFMGMIGHQGGWITDLPSD